MRDAPSVITGNGGGHAGRGSFAIAACNHDFLGFARPYDRFEDVGVDTTSDHDASFLPLIRRSKNDLRRFFSRAFGNPRRKFPFDEG